MSELFVVPLASTVSDNFFTLFHTGTRAMVVDPVDADLAIEAVRSRDLHLDAVLVTHWHPDHVAGNAAVLTAFPDAELIGPAAEAELIEEFGKVALTRQVAPGDTVDLGAHTFSVLDTPGHTVGHVSFETAHHLVSGDVIFAAGAGNVRTGDPGILFATFRDVIRPMPDDTIYYAGHDYAARNLEFALSILSDDAELTAALDAARQVPERTFEPRTIGSERTTNLFLRFDDERVLAALESKHPELLAEQRALSAEGDDHEAVFRTLRSLRNVW